MLIPNGGTSNGRGYLGKQKDGNFIEKAEKNRIFGRKEQVLTKLASVYRTDQPLEQQKKFKDQRGKIRNSLLAILKERDKDKEPFLDLVEQYVSMWGDVQKYNLDLWVNGIRLENGKNNDSQKLKVATNKQMLVLLDKLGISAAEVKTDDGEDL